MEGDDELDEERPLPQAVLPCACHGPDAACDRCPARYETDGHGFPHPGVVPRGSRRLRHCPRCRQLVSVEQWDMRPTGRKPFPKLTPDCCLDCSARTEAAAAAPAASTATPSTLS